MSYVIVSYGGLPAMMSKNCTGVGVYKGLDGGKVCISCKNYAKNGEPEILECP